MSILSVLAACVVLSAGVFAVLELGLRRHQHRQPAGGCDARTARGLSLLAAALVAAFAWGTWAISAVPFVGDVLARWFAVGVAGLLSLVAAGMAACTVLAWRQRWWTAAMRTHYSVVSLCAGLLVAVAGSRHLLPW
ncbi:hypothetical protein [Flindersiella endophytica]